ncbi:MAG: hypothetical protein K0B02_04355 [DPANN group archaeon]|nr:hypothetical protein [DPANN group archaeon]
MNKNVSSKKGKIKPTDVKPSDDIERASQFIRQKAISKPKSLWIMYLTLMLIIFFSMIMFFLFEYPFNIFAVVYLVPIASYGIMYIMKRGRVGKYHMFRKVTLSLFILYTLFVPWVMIYMLV